MKRVLFITGYAQTGKTTATEILKKRGYCKVSTSEYVSRLAVIYLGLPVTQDHIQAVNNKAQYITNGCQAVGFDSIRDLKIYLANKHINANGGETAGGRQKGLILPTIETQLKEGTDRIVVEAYHSGELALWQQALTQKFGTIISRTVHFKKDTALVGVDEREELGTPVDNNGTLEQFENKLMYIDYCLRNAA